MFRHVLKTRLRLLAARKAGLPGVAIAGCGGGQAKVGFTHTTHYKGDPNGAYLDVVKQVVERAKP